MGEVPTLPFLAIPYVLLYFDCRIRQEAFDLEMMAQELGGAAGGAPVASRGRIGASKICPKCSAQVPAIRPICLTCGTPVPFRRGS